MVHLSKVTTNAVFSADVNRDGLPDPLIAHIGSDTIAILLNLGVTPTATGALTVAPEPSIMG
jgi:hypothetical protein